MSIVNMESEYMTKEAVIENLIKSELADANKKFPAFASTHEGYAVLMEEVVETLKEVKDINDSTASLFEMIMENHNMSEEKMDVARGIRKLAMNGIEELIQVAAMCDKFKALGEKKDGEDHAAQVTEYTMDTANRAKEDILHEYWRNRVLENHPPIEIEKTTPSGDPLKMMDTLAEKGAISQEELESFNKNNLSKKLKNRCRECKWFLAEIFCGKHTN